MDRDNDDIVEVAWADVITQDPPTRTQVDVFQYSGGSCIMSWQDVMLNQPPIVGGALNFMYQGRWYMITGTYRVVIEEIDLDS